MAVYLNSECPYCKQPISKEDQLAVCPECGTPHHRDCYFEHGACFHAGKHAEQFEWAPPESGAGQPSGQETVCPACGQNNRGDSVFCNYCGRRMHGARRAEPPARPAPAGGGNSGTPLFIDAPQPVFRMEDEIDGIEVRNWMTYIGDNYNYYLYNFQVQDRGNRKFGFAISAFFVPYIYFLYRKVWGIAALSFALELLLGLPSAIALLFPGEAVWGVSSELIEHAASVSSAVYLAVRTLFALFAVWIYRKHAGKRISRIKGESGAPEEYLEKLRKAGGPSKLAVLLFAAAVVAAAACTSVVSALVQGLLP